jgi:hypothetical protein
VEASEYGVSSLDTGCTLDSRIAWPSSATHDAATSAFSALTLVEEIFESINEETSRGAALRGK